MSRNRSFAALLAAGLFLAWPAQAQVFRTYLSGKGVDNPACSINAPCRLLPAALAAVADGGEIWMLDSANFNTATVNVTKSVSILAVPGVVGSVVGTGNGAAIVVNAPTGKVALRNLVIVPLLGQSVTHGIHFQDGAALTIEDCSITGSFVNGLYVGGPRFAGITIRNTTITGSLVGVSITTAQAASGLRATIVGSTIVEVANGVSASAGTELTVAHTTIAGFGRNSVSGAGIDLGSDGTGGPVSAHISNSTVRGFAVGVYAHQTGPFVSASIAGSEITHHNIALSAIGGATLAIAGSRVTHNNVLAQAQSGGVLFTSGTNYNAYNNAAGSPLTGPGGAF